MSVFTSLPKGFAKIADWTLLSFLFFFLLISFCANAQADTIFLKNKDRIIGEIKEMSNGVLTIKTDYSDSDFKVTWIDITKIKSNRTFVIAMSNGNRLYSTIMADSTDTKRIVLGFGNVKVNTVVTDIVYVKSVESKFFSRLEASVSLGFNYTKSNDLKQLTARTNFTYTAIKWSASGSYNSVYNSQSDAEPTNRTDADIGLRYFLKKDYFAAVSTEFLSNDEQKLKLRVLAKGGAGKYFIHNNKLYLAGGAGLGWNNEQYREADIVSRNSLESYIGVEVNLFDIKDFNLLTSGYGYLSLTEKNRTRLDFKTDLKYDLPLDFFIKFGVTINYDSKPVQDASYNDYVFQVTFGWEL